MRPPRPACTWIELVLLVALLFVAMVALVDGIATLMDDVR